MASAERTSTTAVQELGDRVLHALSALGDWSIFAGLALLWLVRRRPSHRTFLTSCYFVGVRSVGVIMITGAFIGMVLAVQTYSQFHRLGLGTRVGAIINVSVVRELGPVLAATMLAGRVGSAMAAELATMRITEQIDALAVLGANPVHYLVVPRLLSCVLLIPLLTILADFTGVMGGALISIKIYHVEPYYYWLHSEGYVGMWDLGSGAFKSLFFGAAMALISCYFGFRSAPGAEGVGRAATQAFVASFIAILALDFFLALLLDSMHDRIWASPAGRLF